MKVAQLHGPKVKPFQVSELEYLLQDDSPDLFFSFGLQKSGQLIVTCAPARLDIMGGIADYCGANVFEMTLNRTAIAACQAREDRNLCAVTLSTESQLTPNFHVSLDNFYSNRTLKTYPEVRELFNKIPRTAWAGYILGAFHVLLKEGKIHQFPHGATIVINSSIPMGGGVASSAAIEVATLMALNQLYNLELGMMEIARLAQTVENQIVGAPCGIMDQVASVAGRSTKILSILCQPDTLQDGLASDALNLEFVSCPSSVSFIGIYTKVRRSTTSTAYVDTRIGTFMGLAILKAAFASDTDTSDTPSSGDSDAVEKISERLADNYLCNLSVEEFHEQCEHLLPEEMHGEEFLEKYGETVDTATQVVPEKLYVVKDRVEHAIYENARVEQFIAALKNVDNDPTHTPDYLGEAGNLMYESNASYRDLAGLGSPEVDGLVNIARKIGKQGGIYGAKITGGGGGGTVALLCHGNVESSLTQILAAYKLAWGIDAELIRGDAAGAFEFGHILWELKELEPLTHF
ncbi:hypothetical protein F4Y59_03880 [Candidatus Poribacteria bacterium]|nr:hypothetical protein [Candidatus Poribacteria bacterium]MYK20040.1 hypothetical protein [Candidatus Poribacteria bacterium]